MEHVPFLVGVDGLDPIEVSPLWRLGRSPLAIGFWLSWSTVITHLCWWSRGQAADKIYPFPEVLTRERLLTAQWAWRIYEEASRSVAVAMFRKAVTEITAEIPRNFAFALPASKQRAKRESRFGEDIAREIFVELDGAPR